jgi:hypothetical protein
MLLGMKNLFQSVRGARVLGKRLNNNHGIILAITLVAIIIIAILSATIVSTSLNRSLTIQAHVDKVKCEQLCKGLFWSKYTAAVRGNSNTLDLTANQTITLNPVRDASGNPITKTYTCVIGQPNPGEYTFTCNNN